MTKKSNVIQLSALKEKRELKLKAEAEALSRSRAIEDAIKSTPSIKSIKKEFFELSIKTLLSALRLSLIHI